MKYFFRGQGDYEWKLRPSLFRSLSGIDENLYNFETSKYSYYRQEQFLIQEAIRLYPSSFPNAKTDIERMTICQHYALPTRLLDVSGNALVALYFAVAGELNSDGVVYVFRASAEEYNLASTAGSFDEIKVSRYHSGGKGPIAIHQRPILVFPPHETLRQKAQDGSFYLFENGITPFSLNEFTNEDFKTILIQKGLKQQIMKELETTCNIHKGTLFPESLDGYVGKLKEEAEMRIKAEVCI